MSNSPSPSEDRKINLWVRNRLGLHARAAAKIAALASQYQARITLEKAGAQVDAASILDLLTLDCPCGSEVTARAMGPEADQALAALADLFAQQFGEM